MVIGYAWRGKTTKMKGFLRILFVFFDYLCTFATIIAIC
jgi:hypothetical protein